MKDNIIKIEDAIKNLEEGITNLNQRVTTTSSRALGIFNLVTNQSGYLGQLTWSSRPLIGINVGQTARFTGIGRNVELWTWDGTRWMAPGVIVLAQSGVAVPLTGSTIATILANITIPGGCMGPNGSIRVTMLGSMTSNANNKTWIIRYGGAATPYYLAGVSNVNGLAARVTITNRGAVGTQVGPATNIAAEIGLFGALTTSSENSDANQSVQIIGQLAAGTDTMTAESYIVELIQ